VQSSGSLRFSTCDKGFEETNDDTFFFSFGPRRSEYPNLPKILTLRKSRGETIDPRGRGATVTSRKAGLCEKQSAPSNEEFMLDIISREPVDSSTSVLQGPPEMLARGKKSDRVAHFSARGSLPPGTLARFYAKPNIACIWNSDAPTKLQNRGKAVTSPRKLPRGNSCEMRSTLHSEMTS